MTGSTPTDELLATLESDSSLSSTRRLVAAELLAERLAALNAKADRILAGIVLGQSDPAVVMGIAVAKDQPWRIKEMLISRAAGWEH